MWGYLLILSIVGLLFVYFQHKKGLKSLSSIGFRIAHAPRKVFKAAIRPQKVEQKQFTLSEEKEDQSLSQNEAFDFVTKPLSRSSDEELPTQESKKLENSNVPEELEEEESPPDLNSLLADALEALEDGKKDLAEELFSRILGIDYRHLVANQKLGFMYLQGGFASKAEPHFRLITEIDDENASNWSNLGYALFLQERFPEAKEVYKKSLEFDDLRPGRLASLAQVHISMGELAEAINLLERACEIAPKSVDFLFLLADTHASVNNFKEVSQILDQILQIDPQNKEALLWKDQLEKKDSA